MEQNAFYQRGYFLGGEDSDQTHTRYVCVYSASSVVPDPMDCSPPGSPIHEILQQEYWSGLPFPPPKHSCPCRALKGPFKLIDFTVAGGTR